MPVTFATHTLETAPAAARPVMEGVQRHLGHLPAAVGRLATSPQLLEAFTKSNALFSSSTLEPLAREVVVFTVATRNRCHLCVAMHTAIVSKQGAAPELVAALRDQRPLPDDRLEALRLFTLEVISTAGAVAPESLEAFLDHGYTQRNALEVVLGIGTYTMSTLANRLTDAPVDERLAEFAWEG
ncbi:AhpD family alkylhydroperoxidase [Kitasatospora sp. GP30]|uniref:carboxymuconolactone decarboxylase family protein n=1 Tax=Kitasatospora sp. GP30 TaxID=3035084 RepID=UPI000C70C840|nr:carboxymuconolactone decarboxylase family protein [Kitasatospora sp. GP30]MDH6141495.1 AhpD family alkylhydroperoxidase [Kitasatospora sp. GP30]